MKGVVTKAYTGGFELVYSDKANILRKRPTMLDQATFYSITMNFGKVYNLVECCCFTVMTKQARFMRNNHHRIIVVNEYITFRKAKMCVRYMYWHQLINVWNFQLTLNFCVWCFVRGRTKKIKGFSTKFQTKLTEMRYLMIFDVP